MISPVVVACKSGCLLYGRRNDLDIFRRRTYCYNGRYTEESGVIPPCSLTKGNGVTSFAGLHRTLLKILPYMVCPFLKVMALYKEKRLRGAAKSELAFSAAFFRPLSFSEYILPQSDIGSDILLLSPKIKKNIPPCIVAYKKI